jgi:hypothetical protein
MSPVIEAQDDYDHGVSTPYQTWPWPEAARTPSQDRDYRAGFKDGHAAGWNAGYEFQSGEKADAEEDREAALRSAIDHGWELEREKANLEADVQVLRMKLAKEPARADHPPYLINSTLYAENVAESDKRLTEWAAADAAQ